MRERERHTEGNSFLLDSNYIRLTAEKKKVVPLIKGEGDFLDEKKWRKGDSLQNFQQVKHKKKETTTCTVNQLTVENQ